MTINSPRFFSVLAIVLLAVLTSCKSQNNPQEVKEKTAEATAEIKSNAKAVADGIREGWSRDKPLNLNTVSREQIQDLPGVTAADADRIVAGRPYDSPSDLETRGILPKVKYDRIADQVTAKK